MEYKTDIKEKLDSYFASVNSTSRRMVNDIKSICNEKTNDWEAYTSAEQADALWKRLVTPAHEEIYRLYPQSKADVEYYPILRISSGEKIVIDDDGSNGHGKSFGYSWRDEHSAPFSWETQSQIDVCIEALQNLPANEDMTDKNDKPLGQGCLRRKKKAPAAPTLLPRSTSMMKQQPPPPPAPPAKTRTLPKDTHDMHKDERKSLMKADSGSLRREGVSGSLERSLERRKTQLSDIKRPAVEPPKPPSVKPLSISINVPSTSKESSTVELGDPSAKVNELHSPSQVIPKTGFDFLDNW